MNRMLDGVHSAVFAALAMCIIVLAGCNVNKGGVNPAAIKIGMTGEQVRATCGEPLVLSSFAPTYNGVIQRTEALWAYRSGDDIVQISLANNKVTKVDVRQDTLKAAARKVKVGMTADQVASAIGQPKQKYETTNFESLQAGHPRKVMAWMYTDGNASANVLILEMDGGKVSKVTLTGNAVFDAGGSRNGNMNFGGFGR